MCLLYLWYPLPLQYMFPTADPRVSSLIRLGAKLSIFFNSWKGGSSVVRHLPLVLEVPGSIPALGEENFGV